MATPYSHNILRRNLLKEYPETYDITKPLCEECYGQEIVWSDKDLAFFCMTCGKEYPSPF